MIVRAAFGSAVQGRLIPLSACEHLPAASINTWSADDHVQGVQARLHIHSVFQGLTPETSGRQSDTRRSLPSGDDVLMCLHYTSRCIPSIDPPVALERQPPPEQRPGAMRASWPPEHAPPPRARPALPPPSLPCAAPSPPAPAAPRVPSSRPLASTTLPCKDSDDNLTT